MLAISIKFEATLSEIERVGISDLWTVFQILEINPD